MVGGVLYEHGHRMVASFVGFLTVIFAIWIALKEKRKWVKVLGFIALGAVITQGILGGITVLFFLPMPVSDSSCNSGAILFYSGCLSCIFHFE